MSGSQAIRDRVDALAGELAALGVADCSLAFVLGSGLGSFADLLEDRREIPGDALAHLPRSAVPGHAGKLVVGTLAGVRVVAQLGRVHLYEGWSEHEVTRAVRAFARLGVKGLVLTNAAGSIRPEWLPGTLLRVVDHLNLQGRAPLLPAERCLAQPYDAELGRALDAGAEAAGVTLHRGVYAATLGPAYETPAQIEMIRRMGGDAVGMSTACEASVAFAAGLRVVCVSCLTNHAAGITTRPLTHEDVVSVGRRMTGELTRLLASALPRMAAVLA